MKSAMEKERSQGEDNLDNGVSQCEELLDKGVSQCKEHLEKVGFRCEGYVDKGWSQHEEYFNKGESQCEGHLDKGGSMCKGYLDNGASHTEGYLQIGGAELDGYWNKLRTQSEDCLYELGAQFEDFIIDVGHLEQQRDKLLQELLQLEKPMAQAVQVLREELAEARRQLSRAQLEQVQLQDQVWLVKRRLFSITRDCIQSQVVLATQQHEVAQFSITEEELQAQILQLIQNAARLQEEQQAKLDALRAQMAICPRAFSDLTAGRHLSLDLEQYLKSEMNALEHWYEPQLLMLLRRRQAGEEALCRSREQAQDLRAQLGPLREESQRLKLQRICLEERVTLMELERQENVAQYREQLDALQDTVRELRTELQLQRRKKEQMEALKLRLSKEADVHRECAEELMRTGLSVHTGHLI